MKKLLAMFLSLGLVLSGCSSNPKHLPVVSVAQLVSHPSLNLIRDNFKKEMKKKAMRMERTSFYIMPMLLDRWPI